MAAIPFWVREMNQRHATVWLTGKAKVMTEAEDPVFHRRVIHFSSFRDIKEFYGHKWVEVGDRDKLEPLGKAWLEHYQHREYQGVIVAPDGDAPPGYFNLWQGWGVEPAPGDWSLLQNHIMDNICSGDGALYCYVLGWMATAVQRPSVPAEVALVLRGKQGTGKGVFAREFGSVFGAHFLHISNIKHLTGNFNAHLHDTLLLFADEVFCTGRRQDEAEMKRLITEPTLTIEAKYKDVITARNMIHLIVASNERWVVPAGSFERRFCVLDVGGDHMQDRPYFRGISEQMRDGGRGAMLHDLLQHPLEDFDVREVPATRALQDQKLLSLRPAERWWYEKLRDGVLLPSHERWEREVRRDLLTDNFATAMQEAGIRAQGLSASTRLGMLLEEMLPGGELRDSRRKLAGSYSRYWHFPALAECRALFVQARGVVRPWPEVRP